MAWQTVGSCRSWRAAKIGWCPNGLVLYTKVTKKININQNNGQKMLLLYSVAIRTDDPSIFPIQKYQKGRASFEIPRHRELIHRLDEKNIMFLG